MNAQYQYCPKDKIICCYCFKFGDELVCCHGVKKEEEKTEDYKLVKDLKRCPAK